MAVVGSAAMLGLAVGFVVLVAGIRPGTVTTTVTAVVRLAAMIGLSVVTGLPSVVGLVAMVRLAVTVGSRQLSRLDGHGDTVAPDDAVGLGGVGTGDGLRLLVADVAGNGGSSETMGQITILVGVALVLAPPFACVRGNPLAGRASCLVGPAVRGGVDGLALEEARGLKTGKTGRNQTVLAMP